MASQPGVRRLPRLRGRGCQLAQETGAPGGIRYSRAGPKRSERERDRGLMLGWATLFLEFCRIVITTQSHSCSVPNVPAGQTGKKIRESNDPSYALRKERPDVTVQIQKHEHVHTPLPSGPACGAAAGCCQPPDRAGGRGPGRGSRTGAVPLCFLEAIQGQQGE